MSGEEIEELFKKLTRKLDIEKLTEEEKHHIEELKKSREQIGELSHVIMDKEGHILIGRHKLAASDEWSIERRNIPSDRVRLQLIVGSNVQRTISLEERQIYVELARKILQQEGKKSTQEEIAEVLGKSRSWVAQNDPVEHQVHQPKKVLPSNTFTPPHKPESIPPKIELDKERRCQYCNEDLTIVIEILIKQGKLKTEEIPKILLDHEKYCHKNPHRIERKPTEKKPEIERRERTTPREPSEPESSGFKTFISQLEHIQNYIDKCVAGYPQFISSMLVESTPLKYQKLLTYLKNLI